MKHCHKYIAILLMLAPALVAANEWYEGGTLHQATAKQWHEASSHNQLATAADFVAKAQAPANMDQLRRRATELKQCITSATADSSLGDQKVVEIAALCIMQLGYR